MARGKKTSSGAMETFRYQELEQATDSFGKQSFLGRGSHGCVYRGVLDGGKLVAVKRLGRQGFESEAGEAAFANEVSILKQVRSPRVVNLLGISQDSKERLLVVDYMANGTLHDSLHCKKGATTKLGWPRRAKVALQIAKAVRELHRASPAVIHRDIKSSNVLLDSKWNARLGDFGLASRITSSASCLSQRSRSYSSVNFMTVLPQPAGTIGYIDPSYVTPAGLSTKNDVFSFGVLLLELISGRKPIDLDLRPACVVDWAIPLVMNENFGGLCDVSLGPPRNLSGISRMAILALKCVGQDLQERPDMEDVVKELRCVRRSMPLPVWESLSGMFGKEKRVKRKKVTCNKETTFMSRSARVSHGPEVHHQFASCRQKSTNTLGDLLKENNLEFSRSERRPWSWSRSSHSKQDDGLSRSLSLPYDARNRIDLSVL